MRQQISGTFSLRRDEHGRITIRSSRPHVVASAMCFTLRLHMSAAPPRVGLTQALGAVKAFCFFVVVTSVIPASFAVLFGMFVSAVFFGGCAVRAQAWLA
jgi:hypothetical protein